MSRQSSRLTEKAEVRMNPVNSNPGVIPKKNTGNKSNLPDPKPNVRNKNQNATKNNSKIQLNAMASCSPQDSLFSQDNSSSCDIAQIIIPPIFKVQDLENKILDDLKAATSNLSPESMLLAQAIVKAVLAATDLKIAEIKKEHAAEISKLEKEKQALKNHNDHLENYGRKNSIIISGSNMDKSGTNEDTYSVAMKLINDHTGVK